MKRCAILILLALVGWVGAEEEADVALAEELPRIPPKSPAEAQAAFATLHGFEMQLVAAEPLTTDAVAGAFDEAGRLFVVEMRGYPFPEAEHPTGAVRVLIDDDQDGVFDRSIVFADRLNWPTAIACWRGSILVAAAPDILLLTDTDGDLVADHRETLITGFGTHNVQALVNGLRWGPDLALYGVTAGNGGTLSFSIPGLDRPPIEVRGYDFRLHLGAKPRFERLPGTAQYGLTLDPFGNRWVCSNSEHALHARLPREGSPLVRTPPALVGIAAEGGAGPVFRKSEPEPWRLVRTRRRAASGKPYPPSELFPTGYFTSATGLTYYAGDAYPEGFHGNLFVADVGGNLIHRKVLTRDGLTFHARRADPDAEFVTSTDNWFRPVQFLPAPDGTLYILDMYRETIEHPWSIPEDIKAHLDLTSGRGYGRIYRLAPPDFNYRPAPRLDQADTEELLATLEHPNLWHRETAARLLLDRFEAACAAGSDVEPSAIQQGLRSRLTSRQAETRFLALSALGRLAEKECRDALLEATHDGNPSVRAHAVRRFLALPTADQANLSDANDLAEVAHRVAADPDEVVRFELALNSENPAWLELARRDGGNAYFRWALLSARAGRSWPMLLEAVGNRSDSSAVSDASSRTTLLHPELLEQLARLAVVDGSLDKASESADKGGLPALLARLDSADLEQATPILLGLQDGLRSQGKSLRAAIGKEGGQTLDDLVEKGKKLAGNTKESIPRRILGIRLQRFAAEAARIGPLADLLAPTEPSEVQAAALAQLASESSAEVANRLIAAWPSAGPALRREILDVLARREVWIPLLLDALEQGQVAAGEIPAARRTLFQEHRNEGIRNRALALWSADAPSPRQDVLAQYLPILEQLDGQGDSARIVRGREVFTKQCATCHQLGNVGVRVGPDLAGMANRGAHSLLIAILDPNREVMPEYVAYVVETDDGQVFSGLVVSESGSEIVLRREGNQEDRLLRSSIEQMRSTGKSFMPEGLEQKISPEEFVDLLRFLLAPESVGGEAVESDADRERPQSSSG